MIITFKPKQYEYPASLPEEHREVKKPEVVVDSNDVNRAALTGATWEQLEDFYQVSQADLKRHFYVEYTRSRAKFEINLNDQMAQTANQGNATMQKFLAGHYLGMAEKVVATPVSEVYDEKSVNERLEQLLTRTKPKPE